MKTYVISGAGTGIGRATAVALSEDSNNHLVLLGRNRETLTETQSMLNGPDRHSVVSCSVTDAKSLASSFRELDLEKKNTVGVIANAGIGGNNIYGDDDRWDEIMNINVKGTYILCNELLPYLKKSSDSYRHVILISSIVAHMGVPGHSAYCTSKAAVLGLMRSWAVEWSQDSILVNAICPGWVETQMARNGIDGIAQGMEVSYEEALQGQLDLLPLKKMSQPKEIGALIRFLTSGEQTSITGEEFQINNGAIMR